MHLLFEIAADLPAVPQQRKPPPEFAKASHARLR
jgi:hypothetical protein